MLSAFIVILLVHVSLEQHPGVASPSPTVCSLWQTAVLTKQLQLFTALQLLSPLLCHLWVPPGMRCPQLTSASPSRYPHLSPKYKESFDVGSDIFAKFSAYIKNSRKEANSSKEWELGNPRALLLSAQPGRGSGGEQDPCMMPCFSLPAQT